MANWSSPARRAVWERKRKDRRCEVDGCDDRHYSRGLCEPHWGQQRRYALRMDQMRTRTGPCDICGTVAELRVDHSHATEAVRGHLCHWCNVGLGWFRDEPELLRRAARYLAEAAA